MSQGHQISSQFLKLHLGEMTPDEVRAARAAYGLAISQIRRLSPVHEVWQTTTPLSEEWSWCEVDALEFERADPKKRRVRFILPDGVSPAVAAAAAEAVEQKPTAYYVERVAPGMADHGTKIGPWFSRKEAEMFESEFNVIRPLFASPL